MTTNGTLGHVANHVTEWLSRISTERTEHTEHNRINREMDGYIYYSLYPQIDSQIPSDQSKSILIDEVQSFLTEYS